MPNDGLNRTRNHAGHTGRCCLEAHWPRGFAPVRPVVGLYRIHNTHEKEEVADASVFELHYLEVLALYH